jgi:hypothetical protein
MYVCTSPLAHFTYITSKDLEISQVYVILELQPLTVTGSECRAADRIRARSI